MSPGCPLRQTLRCAQGDKWDGPFRRGRRMSGGAKILRCGLKCTTPRLVYASLVASERKLRMTIGAIARSLAAPRARPFAALRMTIGIDRCVDALQHRVQDPSLPLLACQCDSNEKISCTI